VEYVQCERGEEFASWITPKQIEMPLVRVYGEEIKGGLLRNWVTMGKGDPDHILGSIYGDNLGKYCVFPEKRAEESAKRVTWWDLVTGMLWG